MLVAVQVCDGTMPGARDRAEGKLTAWTGDSDWTVMSGGSRMPAAASAPTQIRQPGGAPAGVSLLGSWP